MFSGQLAHKLRHDESGQNLVIAALSMVLVVTLMLVMVGDSGWLLSQRRRMQNAADAAALAGARELALGNTDDAVLSRIVEYAVTFNGADAVDARYYPGGEEVGEGAVPEGATGVVVTTTLQYPTLLAGIVGIDEMTVSASAEARYGGIRSASNLWAVIMHCDPAMIGDGTYCPENSLQYGQTYRLLGNVTGPGSFGWVDWNGEPVGNPELADQLAHPENSGLWKRGDMVPTGPGVGNSAAVRDALDQWLAKLVEERHVTIMLYDYVEGSGANLKYHIWNFAEFILTDYNFQGTNRWIEGEFFEWVEPSGDIDIAQTAIGPFGARIIR